MDGTLNVPICARLGMNAPNSCELSTPLNGLDEPGADGGFSQCWRNLTPGGGVEKSFAQSTAVSTGDKIEHVQAVEHTSIVLDAFPHVNFSAKQACELGAPAVTET